jgi:Putative peptidoglycan binding domain
MNRLLLLGPLAVSGVLGSAGAPVSAQQQRYDADCRPLPIPGYNMQSQPPSAECLQSRANNRAQVDLTTSSQRPKPAQFQRQTLATASHPRLGPGFDCAKANDALSALICGSDQLAETDLRFNQAYQALRLQVGTDGQAVLRQEAIDFQVKIYVGCGLPKGAPVPAYDSARAEECVGRWYENQRSVWVSRLGAALQDEVTRPIEHHVQLQSALKQLGYIPVATQIDGVYGPGTRAAITSWQLATGRNATGTLSQADAELLMKMASGHVASTDQKAIRADEERHLAISRAEADRAKAEAQKAQADAERARAEADTAAAKERAEAEVTRKAAEEKRSETDARGLQP